MKKFSSITRVNSRRTSPIKKRLRLIALTCLTALFLLWLIPKTFAEVAAFVFVPIQAAKTWFFESSGSLPMYLRDRSELVTEIEKLREQLILADSGSRYTETLRTENETLRALLGDQTEERIVAAIIGRPNELPYDVLVIDRGARDGVVKNAPVYIGHDRVIGLVTKVFRQSAVVELVTTPGLVSSVFVVGPNIYTNAVGIGGGQLRIGVPQGIDLKQGDAVMLPAVSSGIFGTINHTASSPTQPEQYGFVSTDVPLQSLRYVAVGRGPLQFVSFEEAQQIVEEGLTTLFTVPVPEGVLVIPSSTSTASTTSDAVVGTSTETEL